MARIFIGLPPAVRIGICQLGNRHQATGNRGTIRYGAIRISYCLFNYLVIGFHQPIHRRGGHWPPATRTSSPLCTTPVGAVTGRPVRQRRTICRRQILPGCVLRKRLDERYRAGSPCGRLFAPQTGRPMTAPTDEWLTAGLCLGRAANDRPYARLAEENR